MEAQTAAGTICDAQVAVCRRHDVICPSGLPVTFSGEDRSEQGAQVMLSDLQLDNNVY